MDLIILKNHDKTKTAFEFLMKTACLKVNVSSAKTNVLFEGAIIAKVKLVFLSCKGRPDYFLGSI